MRVKSLFGLCLGWRCITSIRRLLSPKIYGPLKMILIWPLRIMFTHANTMTTENESGLHFTDSIPYVELYTYHIISLVTAFNFGSFLPVVLNRISFEIDTQSFFQMISVIEWYFNNPQKTNGIVLVKEISPSHTFANWKLSKVFWKLYSI